MFPVDRIWRWAFDGANDHEVKVYMLEQYVESLKHFDPAAAAELNIYIYFSQPSKTSFGDQLKIGYEEPQIRI